ncbi:conserved unknown protein [Ectocarpus siliculosus]|uniref:Uncharacterized protein n=1 Tax=Ectocarpus siliculosus TaxID=2880 RepID=D8LQ09_ECTSI|nr:conserved unknown protein [Ectocarpus siliculosus]|eukprot:CBN74901.1 conserved unknown protein [Ectocarpus siliculosus]
MVRFKHRYLVATIAAASQERIAELGPSEILAMLRESIEANFGDFGSGSTSQSLQVRSFDRTSGVCVIRAGRESHRMVRASLTLLSGTKDARLSVTVKAVAGCDRTLKAAAVEAYTRGYRRAGISDDAAAALLQRQRQLLDAWQ